MLNRYGHVSHYTSICVRCGEPTALTQRGRVVYIGDAAGEFCSPCFQREYLRTLISYLADIGDQLTGRTRKHADG